MSRTITTAELRRLIDCAHDDCEVVLKIGDQLLDIEGVAVGDRVMIAARKAAVQPIDPVEEVKGLKRTINTASRTETGEGRLQPDRCCQRRTACKPGNRQ